MRSGGTKGSYEMSSHLRNADRGVRSTWEDAFAEALGLTWKETSLCDSSLWRTLEGFVIWQTCDRCHLPVSPWIEKRARKRVGEVYTPIQWLATRARASDGTRASLQEARRKRDNNTAKRWRKNTKELLTRSSRKEKTHATNEMKKRRGRGEIWDRRWRGKS